MENNLIEISKILGVTAESLAEMPTDILLSMQTVLENIEVRTDEDRQILYDDLNSYWIKGTVLVELSEVSKDYELSSRSAECMIVISHAFSLLKRL